MYGRIAVSLVYALTWVAGVRAAAAAEPPPPLNPKAGDVVSVREGDIWSNATVQKKEGRKYSIRYSDGTEEWVTIDRLRAAGPDSVGGKPSPGGDGAGVAGPPVSLDGPFTEIDLKPAARGVAHRELGAFHIKPTTRPTAGFIDLTPADTGSFLRAEELMICPDTPSVVVAIGERQADRTPLLCIDVDHPIASMCRVFTSHEHQVVAVADGGRLVLTQPTSFGAQTLHLWEYRGGQYVLRSNYTFVSDGRNKRPDWARLLSPTRLLLRTSFGETYLIDLPSRRQLDSIQCGDITVHCTGQLLEATKNLAAIVLRASDLAIVAEAPNAHFLPTVDPTGAYMANTSGTSVVVTKLSSKTQVAQVSGVPFNNHQVDLPDANSLIVDGRTYYDLKTGIPVWTYNADGKSVLLANGQMLYVALIAGRPVVCMAAAPDAAATAAIASASPARFAISPGTHIAIGGDLGATGNAVDARRGLERSITAAGHQVDDGAKQCVLTVTTTAGPTGKFATREFDMTGPPAVREVDAPSTIMTAVLTKDGTPIWRREMKFGAEVMVNRRRDQTLEQAVADAGKPNPFWLGGLELPGYIVSSGGAGATPTLGVSALTRSGFQPESSSQAK